MGYLDQIKGVAGKIGDGIESFVEESARSLGVNPDVADKIGDAARFLYNPLRFADLAEDAYVEEMAARKAQAARGNEDDPKYWFERMKESPGTAFDELIEYMAEKGNDLPDDMKEQFDRLLQFAQAKLQNYSRNMQMMSNLQESLHRIRADLISKLRV